MKRLDSAELRALCIPQQLVYLRRYPPIYSVFPKKR